MTDCARVFLRIAGSYSTPASVLGGAKHFEEGAATVGLGFGAAATIKMERFFEAGAGAKAV